MKGKTVLFKQPFVINTKLKELDYWLCYEGAENTDGVILTKEMIVRWFNKYDKELECIFCGNTLPFYQVYCNRCKEYKGIQPYVEGWSYYTE